MSWESRRLGRCIRRASSWCWFPEVIPPCSSRLNRARLQLLPYFLKAAADGFFDLFPSAAGIALLKGPSRLRLSARPVAPAEALIARELFAERIRSDLARAPTDATS